MRVLTNCEVDGVMDTKKILKLSIEFFCNRSKVGRYDSNTY